MLCGHRGKHHWRRLEGRTVYIWWPGTAIVSAKTSQARFMRAGQEVRCPCLALTPAVARAQNGAEESNTRLECQRLRLMG